MHFNRLKKYLWIPITAVILLLIVLWSLREESLMVETRPVTKGTIKQYLIEDGKTRLNRDYIVNTPVNGRLYPMGLQEGDEVMQGQVVAHVDRYSRQQELAGYYAKIKEIQAQSVSVDKNKTKPEELKVALLQIENAQLQVEQAKNQQHMQQLEVDKLGRDYQRNQQLRQAESITQAALEEVEKQYHLAQQQLKQSGLQQEAARKSVAMSRLNWKKLHHSRQDNEYLRGVYQAQQQQIRSQIRTMENELAQTAIHAPVNGVVLEVTARDEQVLPAGSKILKIGDSSTLEIETDVLSEEIHLVKVGQSAEISGKALLDKTALGKVTRIYPAGFTKLSALGVEQQRVKVVIHFNHLPGHLLPGTSVEVKIITAAQNNVIVVPEQALFKQEGQWRLFVVNPEGKAELRTVQIGLKNEEQVEIQKGLKAGEKLISEPQNKLKPGLKVLESRGSKS